MIKRLLAFLITIHAASAQTNVYHPFPDSNAVWRELRSATDGTFGEYLWEEEKFIDGDTLLSGITYHKIYESGLYMHCTIPCFTTDTLNYYYHSYAGAIREDATRRIYTFDAQQQRDTLLYDFDLQTGDTLPDSYNHRPASVSPIVVSGVDSVFDGSNYRKRFLLNDHFGALAPLIEGIGSTGGLFLELDAYIYEHGGTLHCFLQNDSVKFTDSSQYACDIIEATADFPRRGISSLIYPNPFDDNAKFEIQNWNVVMGICRLKIYNALGVLVKMLPVDSKYTALDRADIPSGFYFYELVQEYDTQLRSGRKVSEPLSTGCFLLR